MSGLSNGPFTPGGGGPSPFGRGASPPVFVQRLGVPGSAERAYLEAQLGARRFGAFFRMAWPQIDPAHLLWNWHIDLLCDEMEAVARRHTRNAVFCVPPRSLKSQLLSVAFPAWVWTWNPAAKFITGSNEMTLATRDAVKMRRLVKSEWYQERWGPRGHYAQLQTAERAKKGLPPWPGVELAGDQDNKTYFETTAGGHRFCCTPGSNVTGHGADFILCDDPHPTQKAESEAERQGVLTWWREAIPTRLNEPDRGVKMVIQQRVHRQDLAGWCITAGYHKVVLPMEFEADHPDRHPRDPRTQDGELLQPDRTDRKTLEGLKTALGPYASAGQLQQRPTAREGGLFKRHWFRFVDAIPAEAQHRKVRRWDLAATMPEPGKDPDYTVGTLLAKAPDGRWFVEDVIRFRDGPEEVMKVIKAVAVKDGTHVPVWIPQDPGQAGKAQVKSITTMLSGWSVKAVSETGDKYTRASLFVPQCAVGNVYLLRGAWNEALLEELCDFPNAAHDDQVDSLVGGFLAMSEGSAAAWGEFLRGQAEDAAEDAAAAAVKPNVQIKVWG